MRFFLGISLLVGAAGLPLWAQEAKTPVVVQERYVYPNQNLDQLFRSQNTVLIFSYGSLLNKESAAKTLSSGAMKTHKPAVGYKMIRVFDRQVSEESAKRWGDLESPEAIAMLNVTFTESEEDRVNGVIIEVDRADLEALIAREVGYDLVEIEVSEWGMNEKFKAYTFHAPLKNSPGKKNYVGCRITPVRGYALASKEGAAQYGEEFLHMWVKTTYLADRTPYETWEKS